MLSNRDKQLKAERGYHGKSFVRPDGSEVLLDKRDWDKRKEELWARAKGRCEAYASYRWERCRREGQIPAHVIPRHPRRDDRMENLKLYCKVHDEMMEQQSWRRTRFGEHDTKIFKKRRDR